jgi:hypothetical protein
VSHCRISITRAPERGFGHDASGCTSIDNAAVDYDITDFNRYLKSNKSRETRFSTVEIKCDESSIDRVDYPQGGK